MVKDEPCLENSQQQQKQWLWIYLAIYHEMARCLKTLFCFVCAPRQFVLISSKTRPNFREEMAERKKEKPENEKTLYDINYP